MLKKTAELKRTKVDDTRTHGKHIKMKSEDCEGGCNVKQEGIPQMLGE